MNAKKIAEKLREIASFYAPDEGCTNAIYDAMTDIADELDPPEPAPAFAVGDVVRHHSSPYDCGVGYIVEIDGNNACVFFVDDMDTDVVSMSELSRCNPSEVIVKIGCLEGTVRFDSAGAFRLVKLDDNDEWSVIAFEMLDPDTAALVKALLKAQEGAE